MTDYTAVIFDLDGTIADSRDVVVETFQQLFTDFGFEKPSGDEMRKVESRGRVKTIDYFLPVEKRGDTELCERMLA